MKAKETINPAIKSSNTEIDWDGQSWVEKSFSHPERTIRIGTTFSGIGSPEMALQRLALKHKIMFACDIDKAVKKSYLANYSINAKDWCDDVTKLDASKYKGQIDLFVGGSPCQSWSLCGKQKGLDDERGLLFYQFVRVVRECQPKVFIFENVDNMVHHNGGESWKKLLNDLQTEFKAAGLNYDLHWRILDASEYGVPQHRERLFCIGFSKKTNFLFPAPIKLEKNIKDYLDDKTPSIRTLTPRERIRLMGFPDSFKQVVSNSSFCHQAGNSIVVDVMMALFKQMDITKYGIAKMNN